MPVERDIDLDKPLTDDDIRALEEEAEHLEQLAQDAQEDAKKAKEFQKEEERMLNDAVKKIEQLEKEAIKAEKAKNKIGRTIKEVNELAMHKGALGGMGGQQPFAEREEFGLGGMIPGSGDISKGRTGFGTGQERSAIGAQQMTEANRLEFEKKTKEAITKGAKERAENARHLAKQRAVIGKIQKGESEFFAVGRNPIGFGMGKMTGMLAKGGIYGLIAVAVLSMAQQIFEEVKKLYGPGGPFDIRKQMLDRDREITELSHILDRRAGRVFFTSDVELQQGVPEFSNTERLRDRAVRYQALHLGE